jgi:hypothetical protein
MNKGIVGRRAGHGRFRRRYVLRGRRTRPRAGVATTGSAGASYAGGFKAEGDAAEAGEGRCRERQHQGRGGAGG